MRGGGGASAHSGRDPPTCKTRFARFINSHCSTATPCTARLGLASLSGKMASLTLQASLLAAGRPAVTARASSRTVLPQRKFHPLRLAGLRSAAAAGVAPLRLASQRQQQQRGRGRGPMATRALLSTEQLVGLAVFFSPSVAALIYAYWRGKGNLSDGLSRLLTDVSQARALHGASTGGARTAPAGGQARTAAARTEQRRPPPCRRAAASAALTCASSLPHRIPPTPSQGYFQPDVGGKNIPVAAGELSDLAGDEPLFKALYKWWVLQGVCGWQCDGRCLVGAEQQHLVAGDPRRQVPGPGCAWHSAHRWRRRSPAAACRHGPDPPHPAASRRRRRRFIESGGVFKLEFGPKAFIVVSDPVVVRHLLKVGGRAGGRGLLGCRRAGGAYARGGGGAAGWTSALCPHSAPPCTAATAPCLPPACLPSPCLP